MSGASDNILPEPSLPDPSLPDAAQASTVHASTVLGDVFAEPGAVGAAELAAALFGELGPVPAADLEALGEARALLAGEVPDALAHRRTVAAATTRTAGSVPAWAAGMRPERTLGPFPDLIGRPTWIDVFRRVRHVRLVRVAGGSPLATVDITPPHLAALATPGPHPGLSFPLAAGSVWFATKLLAAVAPDAAYSGVRVRGGTISFSGLVSVSGTDIVVPPGVIVTIDMTLDVPAAPAGTGPGADARAMAVGLPRHARLTISGAHATLTTTDTMSLRVYGASADLREQTSAARYLPQYGRVAVPLVASATTVTVAEVHASAFRPEGTAPVVDAAWGLSVALTDPAQLGEADGVGALMLWLDKGLRASWSGQARPLPLGPVVLTADPARLAVVAVAVPGERYDQRIRLWQHSAESQLALSPGLPGASFSLAFYAQATGSDTVMLGVDIDATVSLPVDIRGERLTLHAPTAVVVITDTATGRHLFVEGLLAPPPTRDQLGFGLVNALLRTRSPRLLLVAATEAGGVWASGAVGLAYPLQGIVPTLPDPYAANYPSLGRLLDEGAGVLLSITRWDPTGVRVGFLLPGPGSPSTVVGQRPPAPTPSRHSDVEKAVGDGFSFESESGLVLLDVSSNVAQFGVAFRPGPERMSRLAIDGITLELDARNLVLLTLPAVQWEAVHTVADPDPTFPERLSFATNGVPTLIGVPTVNLVPIAPEAVLERIVDNFAGDAPLPVPARFTLPFGMLALAQLRQSTPDSPRGATLVPNRPVAGELTGGHQLRVDAVDPSLPPDESASLPGYTAQLTNGQPGDRSVLGDTPTTIFNTYLGAFGARPLVPVRRLDLSGYGESLFSDWRNPYHEAIDAVAVTQARFDVLVGRTSYEVVQVRSWLFPYAVQVVRTITIERTNGARVIRRDSGWQAVGDGVYAFPSPPTILTHPGVIRKASKVSHIRETKQVLTIDGIDLAAVYFDADLDLDGTVNPVPVRDQIGFVQVTAGMLMGPTTYASLIGQAGPLGGGLDTDLTVGSGPQKVRLHRVGVGVTQGLGGPEFVMTAWGSPAFPGGGEWSVLSLGATDAAPQAVPNGQGVPLTRAGLAGTPPSPSSPYRFADPVDLAQPDNPEREYGILHATGTQRVFFPRPKVEATDPTRITSTQIPLIADPYGLAGAIGLFPTLDRTVPFPSNVWALKVSGAGEYTLELPSPTFPAGVGRRTLRQAGSVKGDVDYGPSTVTYEVDTTQPVPWRFRIDNIGKIMSSTSLGDVIRVDANIVASAGAATIFDHPRLKMGGSLSVVQDLLTILADIGIAGVLHADMTNEWSLKLALKVPFVDATGEALQIPPLVPLPDIKFDDTGVKVSEKVAPANDEAEFELAGSPMFAIKAIPGLYAVAIIKFSIKLSTKDGTTYALLLGVGVAYELSAGPFKLKGLFALTFFGFIGDDSLGVGVGFLLKLTAAIEPIISVDISLEGQLALISACRGTSNETLFGAAKLTFAIEVTICLVFSIDFEVETTASEVLRGPGEPACALPDVIPSAT
jgi:hypothetical protein